ncbi:MAG: ribonuclease P protein component [Bacteroidota bacterium]|nr:ribonuclease P protein component [Bacteroidota bacterium]
MFAFPKKERLCTKDRIERLFSQGKAFISYPFSVRYSICKEKRGELGVLIVCSKRYQKRAVDRNYIKRRIREAWRLNNSSLKTRLMENKVNMDVSLSFVSKELYNYHDIEQQIQKILQNLENSLINYRSS